MMKVCEKLILPLIGVLLFFYFLGGGGALQIGLRLNGYICN